MSGDWEADVRFHRRLRDECGVIPYQEVRRWRRRFYFALLVDLALSFIVLSYMGSCR